nr:hypothetical protein [Brevibacterium renqingii]
MSPQLSSPGDRDRVPREAGTADRDAELGIGRGRWLIRDLPVVIWIVFLIIVVGAHPGLSVARWLMIHLLVLGAVSHSILVWSQYFAQALLHTPTSAGDRRSQSIRLGLINSGTLVVIIGMMTAIWAIVIIGAAAVAAAVVWHGADLWNKVRHALASRFAGTVRYYLAAAAILPVGVTFGVILARDIADPWHSRLLAAHALLNLLGWIGLTVIGTLMTLWPTMLRTKIVAGAEAAPAAVFPSFSSDWPSPWPHRCWPHRGPRASGCSATSPASASSPFPSFAPVWRNRLGSTRPTRPQRPCRGWPSASSRPPGCSSPPRTGPRPHPDSPG